MSLYIVHNFFIKVSIPHIRYDYVGLKKYFDENKCDFFIPYQGEIPFNSIIENIIKNDINKLSPVPGTFSKYNGNNYLSEKVDRISDLETIPSPYLTGILDEFFETNLIPIIETNRGCPYRCTFCAQGLTSFNKVNYFDINRVYDELDYIRENIKHTKLLHFADANFGIVDRDIEISKKIDEYRAEKLNYPEKVSSNMAKNRPPKKMIEIAKLLGNTAMVISLQSLDNKVLEFVKRKNIKNNYFEEIIKFVNMNEGISGTEIILGLLGETYDSHFETLRSLFDMDVSYIIAYNALILEGTEMDEERINDKHNFKTKFV